MEPPILWQSSDRTITLIDIPRSIEYAQRGSGFRLLSSIPAATPFVTNEPKTATAREKLKADTTHQERHERHVELLRKAAADVAAHHRRDFCYPRTFVEDRGHLAKKRKTNDVPGTNISSVQNNYGAVDDLRVMRDPPLDLLCLRPRNISADENSTSTGFSYENREDHSVSLTLVSSSGTDQYRYSVPPRASFVLGDCADATSFHRAVNSTRFNFILLDPPWPSRSVRRTHKTPSSTYATEPLLDIREMLLDLNMDRLATTDGLIGIWITNKPAIRDFVLGEDGLFACWGAELVEEWLWLKTTINGEPVIPLDGLWRQPYEVFLLGRKMRRDEMNAGEVTRRVIVGVPDLHSRKPCLEQLIEPLLPVEYQALEVFARYLVAGWWSWGNECMKYNWEGYWRPVR